MFILKLFHFTNFWKKIIRHLGLNFQLLIKTFKSLEEQNALNRCDISCDLKHLNTIPTCDVFMASYDYVIIRTGSEYINWMFHIILKVRWTLPLIAVACRISIIAAIIICIMLNTSVLNIFPHNF